MKDPETVDTTAAMKRPRKARMMDCGIGGGKLLIGGKD